MKELEPYDDQFELIGNIRVGMKKYKTNLIVSPTGSGKTIIAAYLMKAAITKGRKVIFSVPRRNLMEQTSKSFDSYDINHSFISSGKSHNPFSNAFIGTIDTMASRLMKLPSADLVVIDETHFGANSLGKVINHYKRQGAWVLGLSASPWKLNGKGLGCWFENMIEGKSVKWLIENKRLSEYKYFCGKTKPDLSKIKVNGGDYAKSELSDFMEHQGAIIGDCVSDYKNRCLGNIHIVRCASIKHSLMVAESFNDAGIRAVHVDGNTHAKELERIFKAFAKREISVVTFCDLLGFGFDLSQISGIDVCIESISDLKPSKSLAAQLQYWGRGLRMKDKPAIIHDHVNNYVEHGFPDDIREWSLRDRLQTRGASEDRALPVKMCTECFFTHRPAPRCLNCGYEYPIKYREIDEVDGELVEIDPATIARREQKNKEQEYWRLVDKGKKMGMKNPELWAKNIQLTGSIR